MKALPYKVVQSGGRCWIETVATGVKSYDLDASASTVALLSRIRNRLNTSRVLDDLGIY